MLAFLPQGDVAVVTEDATPNDLFFTFGMLEYMFLPNYTQDSNN